MFSRKVVLGLAAFVVITVLVGQSLFGAGGVGGQRPQRGVQRPQSGGGQRPQRGVETGRGQRDPQQMREQMQKMIVQRMKTQLEIDDEKWKTVQPLLEKVMKLNGQLNSGAPGGMYGMPGGRGMAVGGRGMGVGGREGPGMQAGQGRNRPVGEGQTTELKKTDMQKATEELQGLLRSGSAESDAIAAKLAAYRNAKNKVKGDLAKAQGDLKAQMTTPKQEARLVLMGLLD